ncbi:MAG: hypothetical protein MPW14_02030 [Candidatus Manganitrophus sp.]|nr:MAG: hypothetical protein MPW14_02030 [Candidatus Manganitrophus sp.]
MSITSVYTSPEKQLEKWRELNDFIKKQFAKDAIPDEAFKAIEPKLKGLTSKSRLFYGFGDNGQGQADPFLTGHIFATYLTGKYHLDKSRFVDFYPSPPDPLRFDFYRPKIKMRDGAAPRPKGFYIKELLPKDYEEGLGASYKDQSPNDIRKMSPWGIGPEGFEFLAVEEALLPASIREEGPGLCPWRLLGFSLRRERFFQHHLHRRRSREGGNRLHQFPGQHREVSRFPFCIVTSFVQGRTGRLCVKAIRSVRPRL